MADNMDIDKPHDIVIDSQGNLYITDRQVFATEEIKVYNREYRHTRYRNNKEMGLSPRHCHWFTGESFFFFFFLIYLYKKDI